MDERLHVLEWLLDPWAYSPGEIFCWELLPCALSISHRAHILHVFHVDGNPRKGSGEVEGLLRKEGEHFLGCDRCVGNDGLWDNCNNEKFY
jgi:hypothetical protein